MSLYTTMMDATCLGFRPTISQDVAKGTLQDPFKLILGSVQPGGVFQGVPCSVQQAGVTVQMYYFQRNTVVDTTVYFTQDPGLEANDICKITDRTGVQSTYKVKGRAQPVGRGVLWELRAEQVRAPQ